jgi:hypothetical protein
MFQRIQVPSEKVPTARVLIVGAGAMGLVTGYHLQLAGAEITFLVRPTRIEALSKPSTLYSYDDATLKRFDGYKLISQASEAQDIAYDYVLLTLDNVASHSVEGVALLAELGTVTRDTSAMVISGGIGFELRKHVVETMGIAEEHVMSGALGNLAHQVAPAKLPIHPPTDPDVIAQADIAYRHNNIFGFFLEDRFPLPAARFAALFDASGVSKCAVFSAAGMEVMTLTIFPMFAGSELMGWPKAADLPNDAETWELTIAACREVASMYLGDNIDEAGLPMTSGEGIVAHMMNYEEEALPLDLHAFHAFHHGGKVAAQHIKLMRDCIAAGEAMGKPMAAMKTLAALLAALHERLLPPLTNQSPAGIETLARRSKR